jgi:hypothetical protein
MIHDGPGVLPGRYAGEAIPIHRGPTPQQIGYEEDNAHADVLAGRICGNARPSPGCDVDQFTQ